MVSSKDEFKKAFEKDPTRLKAATDFYQHALLRVDLTAPSLNQAQLNQRVSSEYIRIYKGFKTLPKGEEKGVTLRTIVFSAANTRALTGDYGLDEVGFNTLLSLGSSLSSELRPEVKDKLLNYLKESSRRWSHSKVGSAPASQFEINVQKSREFLKTLKLDFTPAGKPADW